MHKILTTTIGVICATSVGQTAFAKSNFMDRSEIRGAITYTKPSNRGLDIGDLVLPSSGGFGTTTPINSSFNSLNLEPVHLKPSFKANYSLGYSYRFAQSHTRFFIDYEHFQDHTQRDVEGNLITIFSGGSLSSSASILGRADVYQEMVRTGLQHTLKFGTQIFVDVSAFVEYDWLEQIVHDAGAQIEIDNATQPVTVSNLQFIDYTKNKTHGVGPGIGLKLSGIPFNNAPCLKIFGGIMTSLLYANQYAYLNSAFSVVPVPPAVSPNNSGNISQQPESMDSILTKVDLDFGIDYTRKLVVSHTPTKMGLTLGVRYVNIENAFWYGNESLIDSEFLGLFNSTDSGFDWGRVGPYLQFKVGGAKS